MRPVCRAILVLNVLYCMIALAEDGLPGWRMFEGVEDISHELRDRDDVPVDIRGWLPRNATLVDRSELRRVVAFICENQRSRAPFRYEERATGVNTIVTAPGCKVEASHGGR